MNNVVIIGGGLAGGACAYFLAQEGIASTIYEENEIAGGASGNVLGLYNPRLAAEFSPHSQYYSAAFFLTLKVFEQIKDIDWNPCGALHLITDETRGKRFAQMQQNWGWPAQHMQMVNAAQASAIAGVSLGHDALYLPHSGAVSPRKLAQKMAAYAAKILRKKIENLEELKDHNAIILACGMGAQKFSSALSLRAVRGQVTLTSATQKLNAALCYGGYAAPLGNNQILIGSTFQRWLNHADILPQDDADNLQKLRAVAPVFAGGLTITDHRAGLRAAAPDHFPAVGEIAENLYVSTAHGSHGILSSLMAGQILARMIAKQSVAVDESVMQRLSPARFAKHAGAC